ncbi:MAG: winged helix-turn-helix transcriptional regulator [Solirubrobacteraceae bacterium]
MPEQLRVAAELLERRWLLSIIFAALSGAIRFNEFASAVEGISARMLAERLRDLERAGLLERRVLPSSPPTVEYRLTRRGRSLRPLIEALQTYAEASIAAPSAPPRSPRALT